MQIYLHRFRLFRTFGFALDTLPVPKRFPDLRGREPKNGKIRLRLFALGLFVSWAVPKGHVLA